MAREAAKVLVVEDDREMLEMVREHLDGEGYTVVALDSATEAMAMLRRESCDVVVADLRMPDGDGMEVLRIARETQAEALTILITAFGTIETAIRAIREGAYDYLTKPFALEEISLLLTKGLEARQLREENRRLREEVTDRYRFDNLLGASPAMQTVFSRIRQAAPSDVNILITGESGTGKELVAKALHFNSLRAKRPFVPINCAAVPAGLLESELFGHVKGAFTGAVGGRRGLFREANGGTLFLDEIGDMAPELQAKLLRAIEDRTVRPVGSDESLPLDVRLVAATNTDLPARIREGRFREDLYYRLAVIPIHLPPLRERKDDLPLLAEHFLHRATVAANKSIGGFTPDAMAALLRHPWPGNVRELENVVQRAVTLTAEGRVLPDTLLLELTASPRQSVSLGQMTRRPTLRALAAEYASLILQETGGDKARAAEILGISRRTLYRWDRLPENRDSVSQTETD